MSYDTDWRSEYPCSVKDVFEKSARISMPFVGSVAVAKNLIYRDELPIHLMVSLCCEFFDLRISLRIKGSDVRFDEW